MVIISINNIIATNYTNHQNIYNHKQNYKIQTLTEKSNNNY